MNWLLVEPSEGLLLSAETDGVRLRGEGIDTSEPLELRSHIPKTRLGRLLPTLVPQLLELELAVAEHGALRIPYADFVNLETCGIDAFDGIMLWAPYTLEIESSGSIGAEHFRYRYRYYLGSKVVYPERLGCLLRSAATTYRLDSQAFALVEAIDSFNTLPSEARSGPSAFLRFAQIRGLAEEIGAQLDRYLNHERVLVPSRIGLDLIVEDGGRISFAPKIYGIPPDAMRQVFLASDDVEDIYSLDHPEEGRVRVVLDDTQREVLRRMQRVRHLSGADRVEVLRDPHAVFEGLGEAVDIDLEAFGPRVRGIGDFPFVVQPYLSRSPTGIFDDPEGLSGQREAEKFSAGLRCTYADGHFQDLAFTSRNEILELQQTARNAWRRGQGTIEFAGKSILVDESFIRSIDELVDQVTPISAAPKKSEAQRRFLLIYTNEDEVEYAERDDGTGGEAGLILPRALKDPTLLKTHQRAGLAWLQRNFQLKRRGCLLADDMGLGKALQVLAFLAWLIEEGQLSPDGEEPQAAPWDPILIVAPVILLENETWLNDMRIFFAGEGAIFQPWLTLHGSVLKTMRRSDAVGQETTVGQAMLDLERLRQYRVILTNYETVTNYQHSFARMKDHWTVVVTDEAQEYKTPNTKISHALKSLAPRFRIACTGTPVETRLLDVWNIFDFLQPGPLLGSATEFARTYEPAIEGKASESTTGVLVQLKNRLHFGQTDAFILRREKTSLPGLPTKHEHTLECILSPEQREWHLDLIGRARTGGEGNHPLRILQDLMRLYQHPALFPRYEPVAVEEQIKLCPKLAAVLECLHSIRVKDEKALIFTRSLDMQQLLARVIGAEFGFNVDIINGATRRRGGTQTSTQTRNAIISRFRERAGFDALILSPDVAGIGLTLVEANHVIHYGRWWNPARESQATDRVYRIGQERDVHIYYPIAVDPEKAFETFDEKLHKLICNRRDIAAEFLAPMLTEDDLGQELLKDILEAADDSPGSGHSPTLSRDDVRRLTWNRFEALIAVLEERQGSRAILTPLSGDGGIDVIAIREREIRLLQCKHTLWEESIDADVLAEVIQAFEGYRGRWLRPRAATLVLRAVLATNGRFTSRTRAEARGRDIVLIDEADLDRLLTAVPCTPGDIEAMEGRRLASMRDVQVGIEQIVRSFETQ
jgi:hypothetical protein